MNIFLRYEITARELDANILTGLIAASRGHRAIVCDWPMMMRGILLRWRQSGFVHMNSLAPSRVTLIYHRIFKFLGYRISSMDQEAAIQRLSYESFAKGRYGEESIAAADLVFCWGRDDYETLQSLYPKHSHRIIMTGSPRVDLWRPKFSSVYARSEQLSEPFVVVLSSSTGPLMSFRLHEVLINHRISGYYDRDPDYEEQVVKAYKEGTDLMIAYLYLLRFLSSKCPELAIVVKPHPSEDSQIWRGILGEVDRVRVDTETSTSQLIRQSVAAITSGSMTAFEAELAGTPLISFQPIDMPHRNSGFADSLGLQTKTVEEVHRALKGILSAGREKDLKGVPETAKVDISQKVYFDDNQLAAERMVLAWERAERGDSRFSAIESRFPLPWEELKYFVASAFPFLIPLFVRKRTIGLPTGDRRNHKRPHLVRKLVSARLEQMRSILGLQDSVSYRFKGRRGLVIEPRSSVSSEENSDI